MGAGLNMEEKGEKIEAEEEYNLLLRMEEISWRQKSRATWLKEGDKNTNFFHKMACWRRSTNLINRLRVRGEWVSDQEKIRDKIESYNVNLYSDLMPYCPYLKGVEFDRIDEVQRGWLERPFSEEEIKGTLNSVEDEKAPGPDRFPTLLFKWCWDVMGKDMLVVFQAFHAHDQWCRSLSATFITLIPKKKGAENMKDFRPISLVGCLYKLLAKTLAIRL